MDHSTLFRIKSGVNCSGNRILLIAKILNDSGIKVEPHFQDALIEKNHILEDFFEIKTIEMEVYVEPDFQLWQFKEGHLVDKMGHLPFKDKVLTLSKVGEACQIENVSSGEVMCIRKGSQEVFFKKKTPKKKFNTRSAKSKKQQISDDVWICYPADSDGYFRIKHAKTGNFLTSLDSDQVNVEKLAKLVNSKGKKLKKSIVKVKKTYVWVSEVEGLITFIAGERGYADEDLQIECGIDAGQGFLKIMLSIQRAKDCQPESRVWNNL